VVVLECNYKETPINSIIRSRTHNDSSRVPSYTWQYYSNWRTGFWQIRSRSIRISTHYRIPKHCVNIYSFSKNQWKYSIHYTVNTFIEVLTRVIMKSYTFWDITLCSPLKMNWRFGETFPILLQGFRVRQKGLQSEAKTWLLLRNLGWLSTEYLALYSRRQNFSQTLLFEIYT
jgi:hypothetical protein